MAKAHTTETPTSGDLDNGAAISTGNKLTVASNRTAYRLYFWAPTTNTGTYTLGLYEVTNDDDPGPPSGTLLVSASVASGSVTPDAFNLVDITPTAVDSTKLYAVAVHASSGRFVRTAGALNAAGITANGITIVQSGTAHLDGVIRNGMFHEGAALAYPDQVFGQPDYFTGIDDESGGPAPVDGVLAATLPAPTGALTGVESMSGPIAGTLPALTGAFAATSAQAVTAVLEGLLPTLAGAVTATVPAVVSAGSWYGLLDVYREGADMYAEDRTLPPTADPGGWPLDVGPDGQLFSVWDGWRPSG